MPSKEKAASTGTTIKVKLVRSVIGNNARQRATVESLGLHRIHQVVEHNDTPVTRGMVEKVRHLVEIVQE